MHTYTIIEAGTPKTEASHAMILLHGRGATAQSILGLASHFPIENFYLAAPQATHNTWYPTSFMAPEDENEPWLSSAIATVKRLIDKTAEFIPLEHIYLMGFSQGACLTLEVVARYAAPYAGVAAFTGGLIGQSLNKERYQGSFNKTPIFIGTGDPDPHVPLKRCLDSKKILEKLGAKVQLEVYKGRPHTILREEIEIVKELLF